MTLVRPRVSRRSVLAAAGALSLYRVSASAASNSIRILCWEGYDDSDATKGFRDAQDVEVKADYIGANDEIFTFLRAGGVGKYDVVTPGDGVVHALANADLIQPIDPARLSNATGLFGRFQSPDWCTVDGQTYAVPLIWHTYPMVYNAGALPDPPSAWTDLTDPRFKGKIVMLDDVIGHFLTWNRALGAADPARVSYEKLDETVDTLLSIKRDQAMSYVGNLNDLAEDLASEGGWVTTTGQEIVPSLNEADGANLRLARPSPGDFSVCDCLCLPAEAPNLELAYDFIDHMISVDAQVALAGALYRGTVTEAAVPQLPDHARDLYRYNDLDSVFVASPLTGFPPLESEDGEIATYLDWVLAWDRIRVAPLQALSTPTPTPATTPVKS